MSLVFPSFCLECGDRVGSLGLGALCRGCWEDLRWLEPAPAGPRAAGDFSGVWRKAILAYKFRGRSSLIRPFSRVLCSVAGGLQLDAVAAVPSSRAGVRRRGFDHVERIARPLAGMLGLPFLKGALWRRREGAKQAGLDRRQRHENVLGVYAARLDPRRRGSRLLLVDDVVTTGATLSACSAELMRAGALSVECLALAARPLRG